MFLVIFSFLAFSFLFIICSFPISSFLFSFFMSYLVFPVFCSFLLFSFFSSLSLRFVREASAPREHKEFVQKKKNSKERPQRSIEIGCSTTRTVGELCSVWRLAVLHRAPALLFVRMFLTFATRAALRALMFIWQSHRADQESSNKRAREMLY